MDKNRVRALLEEAGYKIVLEKRYRNYAWRFKLSDGTSVFCGDKNRIWATGKNREAVENEFNSCDLWVNNKVFIVYGRDTDTRDDLVKMLQSWNVESLAIDSLPVQGRTIIEQLEHYIPQANYGIILATPDDIGYLVGRESDAKYRARRNWKNSCYAHPSCKLILDGLDREEVYKKCFEENYIEIESIERRREMD